MYIGLRAMLLTNGVPYQIRTGVIAVKGRYPRPLDERDNLIFKEHLVNFLTYASIVYSVDLVVNLYCVVFLQHLAGPERIELPPLVSKTSMISISPRTVILRSL